MIEKKLTSERLTGLYCYQKDIFRRDVVDYRKIIKEVGRGKNHARDLDHETARALYTRMLDGEVPDLRWAAS